MSGPEPVRRLEELLERLESARVELEQTDDADRAVAILQELAELAKKVQTEVERARREPDAQG
ncbi:MAG: hypothetical protein ACRDOS_14120 [Gaiellaceae bacterium]